VYTGKENVLEKEEGKNEIERKRKHRDYRQSKN